MTCKKCGALLLDDAKFCNVCGAAMEEQEAVATAEPVVLTEADNEKVDVAGLGKTAFILSMISVGLLYFFWYIPLFWPVALILAVIARKKVKLYHEMGGVRKALTTIANIVSLVALILSAVVTGIIAVCVAFWIVYVVFYVVMLFLGVVGIGLFSAL